MSFIQTSNGCQAPDKNNPGTHLFIIGVGDYPELRNSMNSHVPLFRKSLDPPRLTSAEQSALHMANWFIAHYNNPAAPLRSVELVISPKQFYVTPAASSSSTPVDEATIRNIKTGFREWYERCDAREDNIAVFYFAGHGLYCTTQLLLAQDFLEDVSDPLTAAIDYNLTFHHMARCQAKHQFFFIDACRVPHLTITNAQAGSVWYISNAKPLRHPTTVKAMSSRNALEVFATQINKSAYGYTPSAPGLTGPSRFCQALEEHLTGRGATKDPTGDWLINHRYLGHYLWRSMVRDNTLIYAKQPQIPDSITYCSQGESTLHKLTGAPDVPVRLGCDPDYANPVADFTLKDRSSGNVIDQSSKAAHAQESWFRQLRADYYTFEVVFDSGSGYQNKTTTVRVTTPFTNYDVKV